jgi:hypothetical protein
MHSPLKLGKKLSLVLGTPTIRVMEQPSLWTATSECHVQSLYDQGCILGRCHRPSYHYAREQIKHNRKKEPSFPRPDVGSICHPFLVGGVSMEVALEKVQKTHISQRDNERARYAVRKSPGHAQRFLAAFGPLSDHFRPRRHRLKASDYRVLMQARFHIWNEITCAK